MTFFDSLFGRQKRISDKKSEWTADVAFVLLSAPRLPDAEDVALAFRDFSAAGGELREDVENSSDEEGEMATCLALNTGERSIVALMPFPVPNQEADQAAQFSLSRFAKNWKNWKLPPHKAHLVVTFLAPADSPPIVHLYRFTSVLAAVTKASPAVGVYWGDAGATHPSDFFLEVASDQSVAARIMLWSGVSIAREKDGRLSLLSLGMRQLHLPDLLLVVGKESEDVAIEMMYDLLIYVAERGKPLPEGDTVGRTNDERLPVHYVPSPIDPKEKVWRVELP